MNNAKKRIPILVGDKFRSESGEVWTVTERGRFGHPHWVISADRCRQTILQRATLEAMVRA